MRIGLMLGDVVGGGPLEATVQEVVEAEDDGFDNVWFGQVFGLDVMTVIAIAGQRTSRIEIGTGVVPTYPRHPFVMAQQALTVQAATGGRFTLGIGLSHHTVIESMWGMSYEKPARHMREYLTIVRELLHARRTVFQGEVYRVAAGLSLQDVEPPQILVAALAPVMLRTAGELAEGTVTWMTGAKALEKHVVPRLTRAAEGAGRPVPRVSVGLPVCVTDDAASAKERAARMFQVYGTLPNYRRMLDIEGAPGPADIAIVGDEAAVERQIRAVASAGGTDFFGAVFPVGDDPGASIGRTRALLKTLVGKV
jgi:5,10-methylenetetrahydromethanopterin reductase